jgi:tRNA-splicing ligase RtcB
MPDGHFGYGFPIGGVAAMDVHQGGVISPGGIGFDINCGMRLIVTNLTYDDVKPHVQSLVDRLFERVPAGVGSTGFLKISRAEFRRVIEEGARWCVRNGYGWKEDLDLTEESGCIAGAHAAKISEKAVDRGHNQIGTLGSGNHYLEVQVAQPENIFDAELARRLGITIPNQIVVMFHCGSRGFGHQVATDYLQVFLKVMESKYGIKILDRELACAPFDSPEGQDYFAAMKCGLNMSFANRQVFPPSLATLLRILGCIWYTMSPITPPSSNAMWSTAKSARCWSIVRAPRAPSVRKWRASLNAIETLANR